MKNKIIWTSIALLMCTFCANADMCTTTTTSTPSAALPSFAQQYIKNCRNISYTNYYASQYSTTALFSLPQCTTCTKASLKLKTFGNDGTYSWTGSCTDNNLTFTVCVPLCDSSCQPDSYYSDEENGVESLTNRWCNYEYDICESETDYRCKIGYYGTAISDSAGCTRCPYPHGNNHGGANSEPGENVFITDCYIAKSSSENYFDDSTGIYKCTEDAYYKQ